MTNGKNKIFILFTIILLFLIVIGLVIIATRSSRPSTTGSVISDSEQGAVVSEPEQTDPDNDGLTTEYENEIGTDANKWDTDGDGLSDGEEVKLGSNPKDSDTDRDGLNDKREYQLQTSLTSSDTDRDGLEDGKEVNLGSDPLDPDTDNDGLDDKYEFYISGTDLLKYDTDGDGLGDGIEVNTHETDPHDSDSDDDGVVDGSEISKGCNPLKTDTDGDGYSDYSDLFCNYDAYIRIVFSYLMMEKEGLEEWGHGEPDPYIKVYVYIEGDWKPFFSNRPIGNEKREITNPYSTEWINIPDNEKYIRIRIEAWDYDSVGSDDEADVNPKVEAGGYLLEYDITSHSLEEEIDGTKDNLDEGDAVLRFKVETS